MFGLQVDSLMKIIKSEKAARADLEMFVAVLTTQRNVLQDEADKVKQELLEGEQLVICRKFLFTLFAIVVTKAYNWMILLLMYDTKLLCRPATHQCSNGSSQAAKFVVS